MPSQGKYQLKKYERKQVKSDTTFIDSMLPSPTLLFDWRLKLGNQTE